MKIAVDARPLTVPTFGIGRYTREVLTRLVELGSEHEWYLYADRPILNPPLGPNIHVRQFSRHNRLFSLFRTQLVFTRWAVRDSVDLFWSPRHHLPLILPGKIKTLLSIHDLVWQKYSDTMQTANYWVERCLMPSSALRADKILTISRSTKADIVSAFQIDAEKVVLTYPAAAPVGNPTPERFIDQTYFLFVGTMEPRKNLSRVLKAFKSYREGGGENALVLVGAEGWGDSLEAIDGVIRYGYAEEEALHQLMSHATALLLPSLYEGFGLPIVESMCRGVPVITSNCSAMPEIVGDAGIQVDPFSEREIAEALIKMSAPEHRARYAEQCDRQSQKFSWDETAARTLEVILSLAAPPDVRAPGIRQLATKSRTTGSRLSR